MRVIIRGEGITEPPHIVMDLVYVPRKGDYINLGDGGFSRYVSNVVYELHPRKWDPDKVRWVPEHPRGHPWEVIVETRYGHAP